MIMKKITVLLADDHSIVREGIRLLLETAGDFEVVGEAINGLEAVEMARELRPDVLVMDIAMPQLNGLEAARRILQQVAPPNPPKILILSAHGDDAYIEHVSALGVPGYLIKQTSSQILITAIRAIYKGKIFYSPSITKRLHGAQRRAGPKFDVSLTTREREVLQLVAEGRSNKEVGVDLGISIKTVEKHRQGVMTKLDIHDTSGLTRYAISAGIIENSVQCTIIE